MARTRKPPVGRPDLHDAIKAAVKFLGEWVDMKGWRMWVASDLETQARIAGNSVWCLTAFDAGCSTHRVKNTNRAFVVFDHHLSAIRPTNEYGDPYDGVVSGLVAHIQRLGLMAYPKNGVGILMWVPRGR